MNMLYNTSNMQISDTLVIEGCKGKTRDVNILIFLTNFPKYLT